MRLSFNQTLNTVYVAFGEDELNKNRHRGEVGVGWSSIGRAGVEWVSEPKHMKTKRRQNVAPHVVRERDSD